MLDVRFARSLVRENSRWIGSRWRTSLEWCFSGAELELNCLCGGLDHEGNLAFWCRLVAGANCAQTS